MHPVTCAVLAGRDDELEVLTSAVTGVAAGRGGLAWVEGAAGTGKSALIDTVLGQSAAPDVRVFRAAGDELAAAFPLHMMAECIGVARRPAASGQPGLAAALAADGGTGLAGTLLDLVRDSCQRGPVIIAGTALQYADDASLVLWARLAELAAHAPLLLVGAARKAPRRAAVTRLRDTFRRCGGRIVPLGPLGGQAAAELAARSLGASPGPLLRAELFRAGGNPRYVREIAGALADAGLVELTGAVAEFRGQPGATPAALAVSVERSLGYLSTQARAAMRMAALTGDGCALAELCAVSGQSPAAVTAALAEAVEAELVTVDSGRVAFQQPIIRQAMICQIPEALVPALHQHAARTLAEGGGHLASVAPHLQVGSTLMEDWALRWLAVRSEASLYQVPEAAVELLESAVQLVDTDDPRWEALADRLAQVSFWLGRYDGVVPVALEVARRTADVGVSCRMRIFAMRSAARAGRPAEGIAFGEAALADATLSDAWRARLEAWLAVLLLLSGQTRRGEQKAFNALRHAALAGDPVATATAHHAATFGSGSAAARRRADRALAELGAGAESAEVRLLLLHSRLMYLARQEDATELERTLAVALDEAGRARTFHSADIRGVAAQLRYRQGRWDDALAQLRHIDPQFRAPGHVTRLSALTSLIALHRGEQTDAMTWLEETGRVPPDPAEPSRNHFLIARALTAEAVGDQGVALAAVTAWLEIPAARRRHLDDDDVPDLIRLALAAGEQGLARDLAVRLGKDAAADPAAGRTLAARCARAQLDNDPAALAAVARDYRRRGWPLRRGLAWEEAAIRFAQAGLLSQARSALGEAADAYAEPGATRDARRADARLRPYGIRRGPRSPHRTQATGWAALTPAEAQIALLAVDGLSNADIATRLFVSPRTVHAHVSHILAKLQIRSRAELVRAHAEQAPGGAAGPDGGTMSDGPGEGAA